MRSVLVFARRNCLCFFRDRANVAFSLMAALIVVMLYLLVLRDMMISNYPGLPGAANLIDAWVLAGLMGIVSVTSCMGALQTMNADRAEGRDADLLVTPMGPWRIACGYILGTFVSAMALSIAMMVLALVYLIATGCPMGASDIALAFVLSVPSCMSGCIIMYALTSFITSSGAFSGFFSIVSVLIGFLTGIYMPMGSLPDGMQIVGTALPATHFAAVFRQLIAGDALDRSFDGADPSEFRSDMGFDLHFGDFMFDAWSSAVYVVIVTAAFIAIAVLRMKRNRIHALEPESNQ